MRLEAWMNGKIKNFDEDSFCRKLYHANRLCGSRAKCLILLVKHEVRYIFRKAKNVSKTFTFSVMYFIVARDERFFLNSCIGEQELKNFFSKFMKFLIVIWRIKNLASESISAVPVQNFML